MNEVNVIQSMDIMFIIMTCCCYYLPVTIYYARMRILLHADTFNTFLHQQPEYYYFICHFYLLLLTRYHYKLLRRILQG